MSDQPLVSIIVLNYNDWEFIGDCLAAVFHSRYRNFEVTLVDTGSDDDDYSSLERDYPELTIIKMKKQTGFALANNTGIKASKGDYFLLLNNDTIIKPDCLTRMVAAFQNDSELMLAGALGPPLSLASTDFTVPWDKELIETPMVTGFAMMIKKECIDKIGYLEETFFLYGEDEEYGWRCNLAGGKVAYVRDAIVFHHRGGSKSQFNFQKLRNGIHNHITLLDGTDLMKALFCDLVIQTAGRCLRWPRDSLELLRAWVWILKHLRNILAARNRFNKIKIYKSGRLRELRQGSKAYFQRYQNLRRKYLASPRNGATSVRPPLS